MPRGVLLTGNPGLGKTAMAKAFIQESGLEALAIRRNKNSHDFIDYITETFKEAKEKAPCIVFLDDLDEFGNEDGGRLIHKEICITDFVEAKGKNN